MNLECYRYQLHSREAQALNARSTRHEFPGALIRIDGRGVGCIHPWPELGDASLGDELAALAAGKPLPLGRCALECAQLDGEARKAGRSLFEGLEIPPSHWTAGRSDDPAVVAADGFKVVKIKLDADVEAAAAEVSRWTDKRAGGIERLRLDFNESLAADAFLAFWDRLNQADRDRIELIEDPTRFDADEWRRLSEASGASFALDRAAEVGSSDWQGWLVIKAAKMPQSSILNLLKTKDIKHVFTSYMDHAIGQLWAAWCAARYSRDRLFEAGLLSHERFAADPFFATLKRSGPRLEVPHGTGLGCDELLEGLPWKPLN